MSTKWTESEIYILRREYPKCGVEIPELLISRDKIQIRRKAAKLGLHVESYGWTDDDVAILRAEYPVYGSEIPSLRDKFSSVAIRMKASTLNIRVESQLWSENDLNLLRDNYSEHGTRIPELRSKFSTNQIALKANSIGLHLRVKRGNWTDEEDEIIREEYSSSRKDTAKLLEGRTPGSVYRRAKELGLTEKEKWTPRDLEILQTLYPTYGVKIPELSSKFTESAIRGKAFVLGIKTGRNAIAVQVAKNNANLVEVTFAYQGNDNKPYVLAVCAECGRRILLSAECALRHKHNEILCERFKFPLD